MSKEPTIQAYCVRCIQTKVMVNPAESLTKNGKVIIKGTCPDCGLTICRFGSIEQARKGS